MRLVFAEISATMFGTWLLLSQVQVESTLEAGTGSNLAPGLEMKRPTEWDISI